MNRINIREIFLYSDDPSHVEDIYQYMMKNSKAAKEMKIKESELYKKLSDVCPAELRTTFNMYIKSYREVELYSLRRAFAQGILFSYKMFSQIPNSSESTDQIDGEERNNQKNCKKRINKYEYWYSKLKSTPDGGVVEGCLKEWCDCVGNLIHIHINYMYLIGVEYGIYQWKIIDPNYQESDEQIQEMYKRLHY